MVTRSPSPDGPLPSTGQAVHVDGVEFHHPDGRQALFGCSLSVPKGCRLALLGPNGSGKTTLAKHLNGIHACQVGTIAVGGLPVVEANLGEIRRRVGMVFQSSDDQLFMPTVAEDVGFGPANLGLRGPALDDRIDAALAMVDALNLRDRTTHHLSGGERQRVALATVLAMDPEVLVLDEPTASLDPAGRRELAMVLGELRVTQILITHDLPFAAELCDRAAILDGGRVVATGGCLDILCDQETLAKHRLELPPGFHPRTVHTAGIDDAERPGQVDLTR